MAQGSAGGRVRPLGPPLQAGITLLESMIALGLMGILLALGVPAYDDFVTRTHLESERNRLTVDLRYARHQAIYANQAMVACPSEDGHSCLAAPHWHAGWIVFADTNNNREHDGGEPLLRVGDAMAQTTVQAPRNRRRIRFLGDGRSPGSNVTMTFCGVRGSGGSGGSDHAKALIIANNGKLRQADSGPGARDLYCNAAR